MNRARGLRTKLVCAAVTFLVASYSAGPVFAHKPTDPLVQDMVNRGVAFIEKNLGQNVLDGELGAKCICALACFSHTGNPEHPLVKQAIEAIRTEVKQGIPLSGHANYSLGIALILLGSVDPAMYRSETQALLNEIYKRQMAGGCWSYPNYETGDTSQTQFACLGMWMAHRQEISVSINAVERVTNWLIRTQSPDGAFGYQGKDPGGFTRVNQERMTNSMGVAGTASLYVCAELLGFITPPSERQQSTSLPTALKQAPKKRTGPITTAVDANLLRNAIRDGDNWCSKNAGTENNVGGNSQQHYYMYTVERYWAFRDLATANKDLEPGWYNAGVEHLRKTVGPDGSWVSGNGPAVDTAFAVLFLLRSSKKTIQRIVDQEGLLQGGKDLPADLTDLANKNGKIVSTKDNPVVEDVLTMLEDKNTPLSEFLNGVPDQLKLATDPAQRAQQITRLRRMAISGPFQARFTAVKTLGRVRDLDNAPPLIFAITDPDTRISRAAIDGLRFLSRKMDAPLVNDEATEQQKKAIAATWKDWYLSIRPDGTLIE